MPKSTSQNPALHAALLEMLVDLDTLCRSHKLNYQLAAGTLLGAIREQQLIGWDKDADICLPRADFDRFMRVAEQSLPKRYFLQHWLSEESYFSLVTKLRLRGTRRISENVPEQLPNPTTHEGIAVDVFPFDAVQPNSLLGRFHMWLCANFKLLVLLRLVGAQKRLFKNRRPLWQQSIAWLAYHILRVVPKSTFMKLYYRLVTFYSRKKKPTGYVACLVSMPRAAKQRLPRIRPLNSITDTVTADLYDFDFPVPHNYHQVLSNLYGDYMQPPPPAERHLGMHVEFGIPES
ncbi:LicD family protein [Pseudidiomarina taiwanensis]|uniref:LicD/FKTN/FKRP nucleotidyltransferase domain-containing protein n=1 Tax=Pseudidiomarina taiwanensis TaxID=337250 RepID=A0A432ZK89_9GAMM|nr:LicD family protein [Pseudidiomarina taiwanensis]RUO78388.1 hypothetical protein CWI83_04990 [Pseudidiomarina taiwanensis]